MSALGRQAERLNDTVVVLGASPLGSAEHDKLLKQGIIVEKGR